MVFRFICLLSGVAVFVFYCIVMHRTKQQLEKTEVQQIFVKICKSLCRPIVLYRLCMLEDDCRFQKSISYSYVWLVLWLLRAIRIVISSPVLLSWKLEGIIFFEDYVFGYVQACFFTLNYRLSECLVPFWRDERAENKELFCIGLDPFDLPIVLVI